ncbi:MAG: DUF2478 domain-containing protein [Hyphomicrobiales bacterium]|nr:DUF2478 domain-containing protein [Hyphomicrobiales bacterium]
MSASRLAAIVFDRDEEPDVVLRAFIARALAAGGRVSGLVQERIENSDDEHDVCLRDLDTNATLPIMQNLGPGAEGCRVDPAAIAGAAAMLERARANRPDLVVVNRFGRLESEGGGLIEEIGRAVADGDALVVCVPLRYLDAWNAFAGGFDTKVGVEPARLEAWWAALQRSGAHV